MILKGQIKIFNTIKTIFDTLLPKTKSNIILLTLKRKFISPIYIVLFISFLFSCNYQNGIEPEPVPDFVVQEYEATTYLAQKHERMIS